MPCLLAYPRKPEEPQEVICDDKQARGDEGERGEIDKGPVGGEVLKID